MPLVLVHKAVYSNVHDDRWLASLAMECVEEQKNPDMLCGLIAVLIEHRAFGDYFDAGRIKDRLSLDFFQKQFIRAALVVS